jgi:methionyl-tRNA synthetase
VTTLAPWGMGCKSSTQSIVYAYHSLRLAGILLQPVVPGKAADLLDRLGVPLEQRGWESAIWRGGRAEEVDVAVIAARLEGAARSQKERGLLFPPVDKGTQSGEGPAR